MCLIKNIVSNHVKNAHFACDLLESVVLEVGEEHVQILMDHALNYMFVGKILMDKHPTIF